MKNENDIQESTETNPTEPGTQESARTGEATGGNEATDANAPATGEPSGDDAGAWKAKADEHWDRFVRLNADFDNFKKRAARERLDAIKYANEALIENLLPVLDNFEAALAAARQSEGDAAKSLLMGVQMISTQLKNVLVENGLEELDAAGRPFDPNIHEALSQEESDEVPEGHVLRQTRKGYRLKERLIRPASVVVAGKSANPTEGE